MKTIILDGTSPDDLAAESVVRALLNLLPDSQRVILREQKIGNCAGDFLCWVRNPGMCITNDANRDIARQIVQSDLLIYLTPVTFGGYSSTLKQMVDHQIQNISPFFAKVQGETHHARRYARYPRFLAIGLLDEDNPRAASIFRHLVYRNSLNFYAPAAHAVVLTGNLNQVSLDAQLRGALETIARPRSAAPVTLPAPIFERTPDAPAPRRAVLLVGSPRTRKSTSFALGTYLMAQLAAQGIETTTIQVYPALSNAAKKEAMLAEIAAADLVVLAFPLYVDTLPAPVIALLESLTAQRAVLPSTRFAALVNCGFPEAHHNQNALAICAEFSHQAGLRWMGSLALGAGEGMVHGMPLNELDGRAIPLKNALNLAAWRCSKTCSPPTPGRTRRSPTSSPP
jgi:multimeric flavodoxin WrbA